MFSTLRTKFGIPGIISVIALVFAMFGGAYAANNPGGSGKASASSAGKQGPRGKQGKQGKPGPAGPAGPAGATGPAGAAGAKGATGAQGIQGIQGIPGTPGTNGTNGSPWTPDNTLPVGATETGAWAVGGSVEGTQIFTAVQTSISFVIPLEAELGAGEAIVIPEGGAPTTECPGTASNPEAESGFLCVYVGAKTAGFSNVGIGKPYSLPAVPGAGTSGAALNALFIGEPTGSARGTWAVTG